MEGSKLGGPTQYVVKYPASTDYLVSELLKHSRQDSQRTRDTAYQLDTLYIRNNHLIRLPSNR